MRSHYPSFLKLCALAFLILSSIHFLGQEAFIYGIVTDSVTGETLPGVNVDAGNKTGVATDADGQYRVFLPPGDHQLRFTFVGYKPESIRITLLPGQQLEVNFVLFPQSVELEMAVVTAGRYAQKLADVTVSVSVMKSAFIENINTVDFENTMNYLPGVDVLDGQASIRGGGGYSYGAGSRVSVLVDDLPLLSGGENDVKWNFLPVEEIEQVEVLKGASSALYGSSALNGVMNFRTRWPGTEPYTMATLWGGLYTHPERKEMSWWWDDLPLFGGASFNHAQKFNTIDLVVGGNGNFDQGYRTDNFAEQVRLNAKFRHRPKNVKRLSYGLSTSMQWQHRSDFFIWIDADSGAFMQDPDVVNESRGIRMNVDPWVLFIDQRSNKHNLRTRYYRNTNEFSDRPDNNNAADMLYGEYQFHREFKNGINLTAGTSGTYNEANANLYGDHYSTTISLFTQVDYKFFDRLSASFGLRWEHHNMDNVDTESGTVIRAGLNYQAAEATFIRASYGQGYRFPSIAERFTATNIGAVNVFPNPLLESETGWSSEIGLRQGFRISNWNAFIDVAAFWTEYNNMIEFTFGIYKPDTVEVPTLDHVGFKSLNVGLARITGFEIELTGNGYIGRVPLTIFMGYTYMNPIDLSNDSIGEQMLKYRYRHSFKGDVAFNLRKFNIGLSFIYRSFMERIDAAFEEEILGQEIFPGMKTYREENNQGNVTFDLRFAWRFIPSTTVSLIAKNIFNEEYMGRPGDIQPPRNITLQFMLKL